MRIGERIHKKRIEAGLTLQEVGNRIGASRQTVSRYETGVISDIPSDRIEALARALSTTPAYLMGWEKEKTSLFSASAPNSQPGMVRVPRLGQIACGEPILAVEEHQIYDLVPDHIKCDFTLECKGDSMTGARINDGDIVYIRRQPDVDNGEIACVLIDDEVTLKKVYRYPGSVQLVAANPCPILYLSKTYAKWAFCATYKL